MDRKVLALIASLFIVMMLGCSQNQYLPKHALTDRADGVSLPHPIEFKKAGVKSLVVFRAFMDDALLTEVIGAGGVWPFIAMRKDGKEIRGYAYLAEIDYWGNFVLGFIAVASLSDFSGAYITVYNRDAGFAFSLLGKEIRDENGVPLYDPKKFDEDPEYRKNFILANGTKLDQNDEYVRQYYLARGEKLDINFTTAEEVVIDSPQWQVFIERVATVYANSYKMVDGSIRVSHLPDDSFRTIVSESPTFTAGDRFLKGVRVPLLGVTTAGAVTGGLGYIGMFAASLVDGAINAHTKTDWDGYYGRAKIMRMQMAPVIRQICQIYRQLLAERDRKIRELNGSIPDRNTKDYKLISQGR